MNSDVENAVFVPSKYAAELNVRLGRLSIPDAVYAGSSEAVACESVLLFPLRSFHAETRPFDCVTPRAFEASYHACKFGMFGGEKTAGGALPVPATAEKPLTW